VKNKIDKQIEPYLILGACQPKLAYEALQIQPAAGLLLPCNVVVTVDKNGDAVVSAVSPLELFSVVDEKQVASVAEQVNELLKTAIASL